MTSVIYTESPSPITIICSESGLPGSAGVDGADGVDGVDGDSAYVYIAYASASDGTGFTTTFNASLDYVAILSSTTEITTPAAGNFTGLWKKYKGEDGVNGDPGSGIVWRGTWSVATSYVQYDAVGYAGSSYIANASSLNKIPGVDVEWDLWVGKGDTGETGATGAAGTDGAQGPQGPQGPAGDPGSGIVWLGAWNSGTTYVQYDAVSYNGSSYVANAGSLNKVPGVDVEWDLWVAKGTTGDAGAAGADGTDGTNGTDGADGNSAYVYIAYASASDGTGFTMTFNAALDYIAILSSVTEIVTPSASDFAELWKKYVGEDGADGADGADGVGNVSIDAIWDTAGDIAVGTGANTATRLAKGTAGKVLTAGATTISWETPSAATPTEIDAHTAVSPSAAQLASTNMTTIHNYGQAAANVNITLPTPTANLGALCTVATARSNYWRFTCTGKIYLNGSTTAKNYVQYSAPAVGNYFSFFTAKIADGSYAYYIADGVGSLVAG